MTTAYPLAWPEGWPRTPTAAQDRGWAFKLMNYSTGYRQHVTFAVARDKLFDELKKLEATNVVVSSNHPTDRYGVPVESKRAVPDEGVAVYFSYRAKPMVMACDRYNNAAANMRSLGLAIEAMRQLERHGGGTMMEKAFEGFAALPSPKHWSEILGVPRNAGADAITAAYRDRARKAHPDAGGSSAAMAEINAARDLALREVGA
jgi:hypothetical protein